jgi:SSS family solute:Na+ symporter
VYSFFPVVLGMVAFILFPRLENPGLALPHLLAEGLPAWLGGLMLAAIFSAEVSSADAVLFMISTSVARDFVQAVLRRDLNDAALLRVTRITAVAAGTVGVLLAVSLQSVIAALEVFYSLLVVSLFVPLTAGVYSTRPRAATAMASMLVAVPATVLIHAATGGQGLGVLSPAALGILISALIFLAMPGRPSETAPV